MKTMNALAMRLRVLRAQSGMTMREVERASGVAKETLSALELGRRRPHDSTLAKLAAAYGVPVDDLLSVGEEQGAGKDSAPSQAGLPDTTEGPDPLDGWIGRALSEADFALEFERAKASQELANELHRAKHDEAIERQKVVDTLREHHAPPAEILGARRDRAVANAQLTAAAFLATELWRGRDVSRMDPRGIVDDVIRTQREYLVEEPKGEGEPYPKQAGEGA
jgi:transcriptional regulator with XRE-family HTH domain